MNFFGLQKNSPKTVIKSLFENIDLENETYKILIEIIISRNELSKIYDEDKMEEIYRRLPVYEKAMKEVIGIIRKEI